MKKQELINQIENRIIKERLIYRTDCRDFLVIPNRKKMKMLYSKLILMNELLK